MEIFNLRNSDCQRNFLDDTNQTHILTKSLENRTVADGGKIWLKNLNTVLHRNFKKIRITDKKENDDIQKLLTNRLNGNEVENDEQNAEVRET